ncbi:MAG: glycosyltransferase [Sediminibacterium sp.]
MEISPLLSVIVPTYNQEKYIEETLAGIAKQKVNFQVEVLIGDDCSTDNTGAICKAFSSENPYINFCYIYNDKNMGLIGNWVNLLKKARGTFIAVCEGDDYWTDENKLQSQVDLLRADETISICFHQARYFNDEDNTIIKISPIQWKSISTIEDLALGNFIDNLTVVCRNYSKNGIYPDWVFQNNYPVPDYIWHMYNAQFGNIAFIQKCMANYRVRKNSLWSSVNRTKQIEKVATILIPAIKKNINNNIIYLNLNEQILNALYNYQLNSSLSEEEMNDLNLKCLSEISSFQTYNYFQKILQQKDSVIEGYKNSTSYRIGNFLIKRIKRK